MSAINQIPSQIFPIWENCLDKEPLKPHEAKMTIDKIEYKMKQKVRKEVEVRSFVIKRTVTKDFLERQQKLKPFGIGATDDDIRQNVNLTSVQRENVWHPYYEVKLEEEDFKDKLQRQRLEKKAGADMMGGDIAELESKLKSLEEKERQEQQQILEAAQAASNADKKKVFNLKNIQDRKREEEKTEASTPQNDPLTVKLRGLVNDITEEDIWEQMRQFGEIVKVKIPMEEMKNGKKRSKGFAFVTFKREEEATRAIKEGEIRVEFANLQIERALKAPPK